MQLQSQKAADFARLIIKHFPVESHSHRHACTGNHKHDKEGQCEDEETIETNTESSQNLKGATDYNRWQQLELDLKRKEDLENKKDEPEPQIWGCAQDHRKERDIYERPYHEKMQIAKDFKAKGDALFGEKKYQEADYHYQKVSNSSYTG